MNVKDKMTKKINDLVISMIDKGRPYREIAKKTGYSISKVSRIKKQHLLHMIGEEEEYK